MFREKPKMVLALTLKKLYWSKFILLNGSQSARPFEMGCGLNIFQMVREKIKFHEWNKNFSNKSTYVY